MKRESSDGSVVNAQHLDGLSGRNVPNPIKEENIFGIRFYNHKYCVVRKFSTLGHLCTLYLPVVPWDPVFAVYTVCIRNMTVVSWQ